MYKTIACFGVWDHFHPGHESVISYAYSIAEKVILGVIETQEPMEWEEFAEPYEQREAKVLEFVKSHDGWWERTIPKLNVKDYRAIADIKLLYTPEVEANVHGDDMVGCSEQALIYAYIRMVREDRMKLKSILVKAPTAFKDDGSRWSSTEIRRVLSKA